MEKPNLFSVLLACSMAGLTAGSPSAFAGEPVGMVDDTTCWRNQTGAIVSCTGSGRAGNQSDRAHNERLHVSPGGRGSMDTETGPWVSAPARQMWTIPAINKRWHNPSKPQDWTIPPMSRRWNR
jgi:hypothetical protein